MAIVGVKTGLNTTIEATTMKTGLIWYMDDGKTKGQSSDFAFGSAMAYLGKALNSIGNKAAARQIRVASNANV